MSAEVEKCSLSVPQNALQSRSGARRRTVEARNDLEGLPTRIAGL